MIENNIFIVFVIEVNSVGVIRVKLRNLSMIYFETIKKLGAIYLEISLRHEAFFILFVLI